MVRFFTDDDLENLSENEIAKLKSDPSGSVYISGSGAMEFLKKTGRVEREELDEPGRVRRVRIS